MRQVQHLEFAAALGVLGGDGLLQFLDGASGARVRRQFFELPVKLGQLVVGEILKPHIVLAGALCSADQLVELYLDGFPITVLGVLDEKHHEEGDNGRTGIDDELPGIAEMKQRSSRGPNKYHENSPKEHGSRSSPC